MDNAARHPFEDPTEVSQADLAPPSEQELIQQQNQARESSSAQPGEEPSQNPPREGSAEDPSSASQQVRARCVDVNSAAAVVLTALLECFWLCCSCCPLRTSMLRKYSTGYITVVLVHNSQYDTR